MVAKRSLRRNPKPLLDANNVLGRGRRYTDAQASQKLFNSPREKHNKENIHVPPAQKRQGQSLSNVWSKGGSVFIGWMGGFSSLS